MMTPERRAEIERLNSKHHDSRDWEWHAFNELLAEMHEIDRLNKVVDQAINFFREDDLVFILDNKCNHPELGVIAAAELERRSNA